MENKKQYEKRLLNNEQSFILYTFVIDNIKKQRYYIMEILLESKVLILKFKIYNKDLKRYNDTISRIVKNENKFIISESHSNVRLELSLPFSDKNNKQIFEQDVLKDENGQRVVIIRDEYGDRRALNLERDNAKTAPLASEYLTNHDVLIVGHKD